MSNAGGSGAAVRGFRHRPGKETLGHRPRLSHAIAAFLRQMTADGRAPSSIESYRRELIAMRRRLGDMPLGRLRVDRVTAYLISPGVQLRADGSPKQATRLITQSR
jgi:hypothetical protein